MPLPNGSVGNKQISMNQMRTEFGISGAISMNQLYRGGGEVPSTQTTTSTVNQGGTISISSLVAGSGPFGSDGANSTFFAYRVAALPVTAVNGDVITSYGGTSYSLFVIHNGQSGSGGPGVAGQIYLGNSTGVTQNGSVLAQAVLPSNGTANGTLNISNNTSLSNQGGATHLVYKASGGGPSNQQDNSEYDVSLGSSSMTITQNRQVSNTSNINTSVPSGGVGDTEFEFEDLWGAFDV
tara:strand:- start:311 stop:1024 length:714 start_codon:yes stop_codon:yes gene_type:complete